MQAPDIDFPVRESGTSEWPLAGALVAVCKDHFTFLTAESEAPAVRSGVESRIEKLEVGLNQLITLVGDLRKPVSPPAAAAAGSAKAAVKPKEVGAPPGLEGIEANRARQALAAGVDPAALAELQGLLGLPATLGPKKLPGKEAATDPDSSEEEEEELAAEDGGSGGQLGKAVVDLAKIVKDMRKEKKQLKDKGLESILDRAEGSGSRDVGGSNRSKAAALRSLQQLITNDPSLIYQALEKNLQADWELSGSAPGVQISQISARGWLEHRSKIQNYVSSVRPAWTLAGIWDCLRQGRVEEARARAALGVAMLDQVACDRGNWLMGAEATLEAPPPFSSFSQHTAPESWELQHSKLLDPRWIELFLAKLKDMAEYQEKKAKLGGRPRGPDPPQKEGKDLKPEPKAKGKGSGKSGKTKREGTDERAAPPATDS